MNASEACSARNRSRRGAEADRTVLCEGAVMLKALEDSRTGGGWNPHEGHSDMQTQQGTTHPGSASASGR